MPYVAQSPRLVRAQLRCYLCTATCGSLEAPAELGLQAVARFFPADGSHPHVLAWQTLRCPRCGCSSLLAEEPELMPPPPEKIDWMLDRPRRGRPPAWLVAARSTKNAA
ncbi:MAG: hypothetical protein ACR2IK_06230 [Chloroflexota bacterium]